MRILRIVLIQCWLLSGAHVAAQPVLEHHDAFNTRFGLLQVVRQGFDEWLTLNGAAVPLGTQPRWYIRGAWAMADDPHDWVLVAWHHGGNSCGGAMRFLRIGASGLMGVSPEIDDCAGRVLDLRVLPGAVELDISDRDLSISHNTYRFTGEAMTVTAHAPPPTAPARGGADVTRWIGEHPASPFAEFSEQARFRTIMADAEVERLVSLIGPAGPAVRRGDWVFGKGCQAHNCNGAAGYWGLRVSDGAVVAAMLERGAALRLFGPLAGDPAFRAWIAENPL